MKLRLIPDHLVLPDIPVWLPYVSAGLWQVGLSLKWERTRFEYPVGWQRIPTMKAPVMRYWQTGPFVIRYFPEIPRGT